MPRTRARCARTAVCCRGVADGSEMPRGNGGCASSHRPANRQRPWNGQPCSSAWEIPAARPRGCLSVICDMRHQNILHRTPCGKVN
eukprot:362504-Chlamydomonas_euryale.AAC.18